MAKLYNLARMSTATTGTGTITLGSAISGYLSFAGAGVQDGDVIAYAIEDGSDSEIGYGTYTASGTTLTRTVLKSTNSDAAIDLSGGAQVFITPSAEDFNDPDVNSINGGPIAGNRNRLINGSMTMAQRGTTLTSTGSANNDDRYVLDRWVLLSDGNDIVDVTRATDIPTNGRFSMGLDVETVDKKFGIFQPIERLNCIGLIGNTVTLSAYLRVTNATRLAHIKMAILAWTGTSDTVTSDVVSSWNADNTNPTLATNWTYENTPASLGVTTSWARYSVTAAIDTASTLNVGVFIWSDNVSDTDLGDFLYITDVQLEIGSNATPFERRLLTLEQLLCERYYCKTYNIDTAPASATAQGAVGGPATNSDRMKSTFCFRTRMRGVPTVTIYDIQTGDANQITDDAAVDKTFTTPTFDGADETGFRNIRDGAGNSLTVGAGYNCHFTADAEM